MLKKNKVGEMKYSPYLYISITIMNLDNREEYLKERKLLCRLPTPKLKKLVGELHKLRYEENDVESEAYYRLASSVLISKTREGGSLIFHLQNFIGVLLFTLLFRILVE